MQPVLYITLLYLASIALAQPDPACSSACPTASPPADCVPYAGAQGESVDLQVSSCFLIPSSTQPYVFRYVNILSAGTLWFVDDGGVVDFRVSSMLVEQGGRVVAGQWCKPFGCQGGSLKVGLWGTDPTNQGTVDASNKAIQCRSPGGCYPQAYTSSPHCCRNSPFADPCNSVTDCTLCASGASCTSFNQNSLFEGYNPAGMPRDSAGNLFGFKVLAVSYGGSLEFFGRKGVRPSDLTDPSTTKTTQCPTPSDPYLSANWAAFTGYSWVRLGAPTVVGTNYLYLDRFTNWQAGDQIVLSTTDWHASHSELLTLASAVDPVTFKVSVQQAIQYIHDGNLFGIHPSLSAQSQNPNRDVDMRAAVGLLTRSISVYSLGDTSTTNFPAASQCTVSQPDNPACYFGGHTIVRQGFARYQVQGVEFRQLGQGGRIGHYPVHFHLAKQTYYTNAFVKDSSSWDSMTRFYTVHATHGVSLERNVGFLSIGHGYYLEDGSEINNNLCFNLAVGLRAPLLKYLQAQPPSSPTARKVPGILPYTVADVNNVQQNSAIGGDDFMPVAFWTLGMYNDIVGNMAAGVGGFGSCFWLLGSALSGASKYLTWTRFSGTEEDYAAWGSVAGRVTPFKRFRDNSCSTSYAALQTASFVFPSMAENTGYASPGTRNGIVPHPPGYVLATSELPIANSNYQPTKVSSNPTIARQNTAVCGRAQPLGSDGLTSNADVCSGPIIDRFRASFNWPELNFGAVWLRGYWFVVTNSFVTDQLFGGIGLVTGGNWQDVPPGFWMLIANSTFVGPTQRGNRFANFTGPIFTQSEFNIVASAQLLYADGTGFVPGDLNPSRPITIYDGPFFADGNNFIGITNFTCDPSPATNDCGAYMFTLQPKDMSQSAKIKMNVMNAAVGWKQTNGFYYPPSFAFKRSAFDNITMRHNVLDFTATYVKSGFGINPYVYPSMFNNARTIDATTIIIDMDGTFTGVYDPLTKRSSSISENSFFNAPAQTPECKSFGVQTTPSDMVTTVIVAAQSVGNGIYSTTTAWNAGAKNTFVPIYRQLTLPDDVVCDYNMCGGSIPQNPMFNCTTGTFMAGATIWTPPMLTTDRMTYFIDTHPQPLTGPVCSLFSNNFWDTTTLFQPTKSYAVFQIFPQPTVSITYQIYVGKSFRVGVDGFFARTFTYVFAGGDNNQQAIVPLATYPANLATLNEDGVLTIELNNAYISDNFAFNHTELYAKCVPRDLCDIDSTGTKCVVSSSVTDPQLRASLSDACSFWASSASGVLPETKRTLVDCPAGGCLAYYFTLPADFAPRPYAEVGKKLAKPFTCAAPWNVDLVPSPDIPNNTCPGKTSSVCQAPTYAPPSRTPSKTLLKGKSKGAARVFSTSGRVNENLAMKVQVFGDGSGSGLTRLPTVGLLLAGLCLALTVFL